MAPRGLQYPLGLSAFHPKRKSCLSNSQQVDILYCYHHNIEAGAAWRPEINSALEKAFAVVVVTPESMKSTYVTYELSWACGSSVQVSPLLMTGSYDDIHGKLLDKQCVGCRKGTGTSAIETIERRKRTPPEVEILFRGGCVCATRILRCMPNTCCCTLGVTWFLCCWLSGVSLLLVECTLPFRSVHSTGTRSFVQSTVVPIRTTAPSNNLGG